MKAILRGSEDNAVATFNASHRGIKDAIKRGVELEQALNEPRLDDLERARRALGSLWPVLRQEADIPEELSQRAATLKDLLARETFFKELSSIEQHAKAIEVEYQRRFDQATTARAAAYDAALVTLASTPGWSDLDDQERKRIASPLEAGRRHDPEASIAQLRADLDACEGRLTSAVADLFCTLDGERLVTVSLGSYFTGGVETVEQLDAALQGIREECSRLIGAGKKVFVR
jgi:hypothetical protein